MATTFAAFMTELKREAKAEGPSAVAELNALGKRFRKARREAKARRSEGAPRVRRA
jgi:hypothetical protein